MCVFPRGLTPGLAKSCSTKSKLYKIFKTRLTVSNEIKYKEYRNKLKMLLKKRDLTVLANLKILRIFYKTFSLRLIL